MQINCPNCNNPYDETLESCPHCANQATNSKKPTNEPELVPRTIDELRQYCEAKKIPMEKYKMFLGENWEEPTSFGIYKNESTERFIVFNNKPNGQRKIMYEGYDESAGVNILYKRLNDPVELFRLSYENGKIKKKVNIAKNIFQGIVLTGTGIFFIFGIVVTILDWFVWPKEYTYIYKDTTYILSEKDDTWYYEKDGKRIPTDDIPTELLINRDEYSSYKVRKARGDYEDDYDDDGWW